MGDRRTAASARHGFARARRGVRRRQNWMQLARFCAVGATGYLINLSVFAALVSAGAHYLNAAILSFGAAVSNNYVWNRVWTFRHQRGHVAYQGIRFFLVALMALMVNEIFLY